MILFKRFLKSIILTGWGVLLIMFASIAYTGQVSNSLDAATDWFDKLIAPDVTSEKVKVGGTGVGYLYDFEPFTPYYILSATMNSSLPNWIDAKAVQKKHGLEDVMVIASYHTLFDAVDDHLIAIVQNRSLDPNKVTIPKSIIPIQFHHLMVENEDEVKLPEIAINYINQQRAVDSSFEFKVKLVDNFFIMLVLGAFGSLVFLIKGFLELNDSTSLSAYIFRPILGMFLAMAVFLLDILAHSIISSAKIEMMRVEPLYILGFAAGLLSEQAYTLLQERSKAALEKTKEENTKGTETEVVDS
ncbi:hypothetical protein [Vibrio harveyi]|uniref:hypothetical protein n=1 Tax=Vibrio harveyi TaxID=669 RepID=UPI0006833033|nr:hypothetical protein [Vibrio harveyi]PNM43061.1 hypothetical protein AL469_024460 [Vibrio harveyi]